MLRQGSSFISVAALSAVVVLDASVPQITSVWPSHEIRIDGVNAEWTAIDELEKGPGVAVANDDAFVYVIVTASDQQVRREIGSGVILWFDPTGAKKETFGIGIPGPLRHMQAAGGGGRSSQPPEAGIPASIPAESIEDFDVYGPEKNERHWIRMDPAFGISMAAAMTEGTLVYELKLPLKKTEAHPYAIGAGPGSQLAFAIATPVVPQTHAAGTGGGGGYGGGGSRSGGMGRGGGGRGGGMGGGGQNPSAPRPEAIKIWTKLTLASPPAAR